MFNLKKILKQKLSVLHRKVLFENNLATYFYILKQRSVSKAHNLKLMRLILTLHIQHNDLQYHRASLGLGMLSCD